MSIVTVRHKVKDFDGWKKAFDAHKPMRDKAGLKLLTLERGIDVPNEVQITMEAADIGKAREFAASEDLKTTMVKAGVLGPPEVFIGNTV